MRALAVIPLLLLAACATKPVTVGVPLCPKLADYTMTQQAQVGDELAKLPDTDALKLFLEDYGALRSALRKNCGKN